jgi:hypothetical protein
MLLILSNWHSYANPNNLQAPFVEEFGETEERWISLTSLSLLESAEAYFL